MAFVCKEKAPGLWNSVCDLLPILFAVVDGPENSDEEIQTKIMA
jgi:hypothetical protein